MQATQTPVRYDPSVEEPGEDEPQIAAELVETLRKILDVTFQDYGHAVRSVHAKSHGLLYAELTVFEDLPRELAQGMFAQPGSHPVVMRFSTTPGDLLSDNVSTPRGVAIKVLNVEGGTQDFVLVDGKTFSVPNGRTFLNTLKLLASTTDKAEGAKEALSAALRGIESVLEAAGGQSATLKALGGQPRTHILGDSFFSQVPIRYGDYIAKVGLVPIAPELTALTNAPLEGKGHDNAIREAVNAFFAKRGGIWELRVQLCTDLEKMPVENASTEWPEDLSPYVAVARIRAAPQVAWSSQRSEVVDDGMSFSPWHCIAAHRPLGSIMRLRKDAYDMSAQFRSERNRCPVHEPVSLRDLRG